MKRILLSSVGIVMLWAPFARAQQYALDSQDGAQAVLAWPIDWEGYSLEYSSSLTPPSWQPETDAVEEEDEWRVTVTLPLSGARFYRLRLEEAD